MTRVKDDDRRTCQNFTLKLKSVVVVVFLKTAMSQSLPTLLEDLGKILKATLLAGEA